MKHSLKVVFTASSGVSNLPEVVVVVLINDVQTAYCDSKIKTVIPKQDWMAKLRDGEPEYWKWYTGDCAVHPQLFRDEFHNLKKRLNQTGGMFLLMCFTFTHVASIIYPCCQTAEQTTASVQASRATSGQSSPGVFNQGSATPRGFTEVLQVSSHTRKNFGSVWLCYTSALRQRCRY